MNVSDAILKRRSTRKFTGRQVTEAMVRRLLELATWAPTAGRSEGWHFIIVRENKEKVYAAYDRGWMKTAPVLIVVCADLDAYSRYGERGRRLFAIQDTAAAVENLMLAATEAGLATCWVGAFDEAVLAKNLNLPANVKPVAVVPLGWPDETPLSARKPVDQVCHKEKW